MCGAELSRTTAATPLGDHGWGAWETVTPPTCIDAGTQSRTCTVCGQTETAAAPAPGHDYVEAVTAPTCTDKGYTTHTCTRCGDSYTDGYTDALGHDWGAWTEKTPATASSNGEEERACTRCGITETRPIPMTGHTHAIYKVEGKPASCTEAGVKEHYACDGCGLLFSDAEGTSPLGADDVTIAPLGHDYAASVTAPTCLDKGFTTYTCSRCGQTYTGAETAALGHDWGAWTEKTPATETAPGEETRTCARCGETETRPIPILGSKAGDVNNDGKVNALDAVRILRHILGLGKIDDAYIANADCDGTPGITADDAAWVLKHMS